MSENVVIVVTDVVMDEATWTDLMSISFFKAADLNYEDKHCWARAAVTSLALIARKEHRETSLTPGNLTWPKLWEALKTSRRKAGSKEKRKKHLT